MLISSFAIHKQVVFSNFTKAILNFIIVMGLASCRTTTPQQGMVPSIISTQEVQVATLPPMTITPPLLCKPAPNVNLEATFLSESKIHIKIIGLKPSEHITLIFYAEDVGRTYKIESTPLEGANAQGVFEYTEYGLDKSFKEWQIQVVHSDGIACATTKG